MDETAGAAPYFGFEAAYHGPPPPWDIGRPQPALMALARAGALVGPVLDVGCGTGEHALMAAEYGLEATGIDAAPTAIALARHKATQRGLWVDFIVGDALALSRLGRTFGTVLDCGLFHGFSDVERVDFVAELRAVVALAGRYFMLGFSDRQPGIGGPRRLRKSEIEAAFADGWHVEAIERTHIETRLPQRTIEAWLATIVRD